MVKWIINLHTHFFAIKLDLSGVQQYSTELEIKGCKVRVLQVVALSKSLKPHFSIESISINQRASCRIKEFYGTSINNEMKF